MVTRDTSGDTTDDPSEDSSDNATAGDAPIPNGTDGGSATSAAALGAARAWTPAQEAALVAAVQRGEERAMMVLYERYTPILRREAARLGVASSARGELVADALRGVVLALVRPGSTAPQSLAGYAIIALRHARQSGERQARRIEALERALRQDALAQATAEHPPDALTEPVVDPSVRAHTAGSPGDMEALATPDPVSLPPSTRYARVLAALTAAISARITAEEWQLLVWLADYVPQRDIGRWLGVSHGAVRVRVHRLRERLRAVAREFAKTLPLAEQRELDRFFRRAGMSLPSTPTRRASRGRSASDAETS